MQIGDLIQLYNFDFDNKRGKGRARKLQLKDKQDFFRYGQITSCTYIIKLFFNGCQDPILKRTCAVTI